MRIYIAVIATLVFHSLAMTMDFLSDCHDFANANSRNDIVGMDCRALRCNGRNDGL